MEIINQKPWKAGELLRGTYTPRWKPVDYYVLIAGDSHNTLVFNIRTKAKTWRSGVRRFKSHEQKHIDKAVLMLTDLILTGKSLEELTNTFYKGPGVDKIYLHR